MCDKYVHKCTFQHIFYASTYVVSVHKKNQNIMIKYELKWAQYALYCIINKGIKKNHCLGGGMAPIGPPGSTSA